MEILIIWAIFAIISGIIASNNGMSVIGHVLLGIVLGIFGTAITALIAITKPKAA